MSGMVLLKEAKFVDNITELPSSYRAVFEYDEDTEYLVFVAEDLNTGDDVRVVIRDGERHEDLENLKKWTERESISSLAGQVIPVQSTGFEDDYMFPHFNFEFTNDIEDVKQAYEMGAIEYKDGEWIKSDKMTKQEQFLDKTESLAGSGFWFSLAISIFVPFEFVSSIMLIMAISLYITQIFADKRKRPIKYLMNRY
mgnify:CR=1 FL=1